MIELITCVEFYSHHPRQQLLFRNQDSHITNADSEQSHVPVKSADLLDALSSVCATMESVPNAQTNTSTNDTSETTPVSDTLLTWYNYFYFQYLMPIIEINDMQSTQGTMSTPTRVSKPRPLIIPNARANLPFWEAESFHKYVEYKQHVQDYLTVSTLDKPTIQQQLQHYKDDDEVLSVQTERLSKMDFIRLASTGRTGWLSDQIINTYARTCIMPRNHYINRCNPNHPLPNWLIVNCHHLHKILQDHNIDPSISGRYNRVEDEMLLKHDNFNEYRGLLIPYNHKANHWTLIKVDFEERQITYLDSMYSNLQKYDDFVQVRLQAVRTSLTNRMVRLPHLSRNIPEEAWVLISDGVGVSIQRNTFDCGVFTLMMADFITLGFQIDGLVPISRAYRRMILVQLWNLLNGEE